MQFFRDMAINPFLVTGLCAGLLASVACGVVGPYVITRRIVFLTGAIAHMAVGGIGAAKFISWVAPQSFSWLLPIHGAFAAALISAVVIGLVHQRVQERMDTLIGAMWSVGMATGILLIKFTPGYQAELMSYLFGNITYVSWQQVTWTAVLCVVVLLVVMLFHKRLLAVCLDEQQAQLQGVSVLATNIVLLCLVAITVICLTRVVGLILIIALLTLPAATAAHYTGRMGRMMLLSIGLAAAVTTLPRIAVYELGKIPPEPAIVLGSAGLYLATVLFRSVRRLARRPANAT